MQIHVVKAGESLYSIARQYGVSPTLLGRLNAAPADGALAVGQTLVIYEPERVHVVLPGETLERIGAWCLKAQRDPGLRRQCYETERGLIDGLGAARIAQILITAGKLGIK